MEAPTTIAVKDPQRDIFILRRSAVPLLHSAHSLLIGSSELDGSTLLARVIVLYEILV